MAVLPPVAVFRAPATVPLAVWCRSSTLLALRARAGDRASVPGWPAPAAPLGRLRRLVARLVRP